MLLWVRRALLPSDKWVKGKARHWTCIQMLQFILLALKGLVIVGLRAKYNSVLT